MLKKSNKKVVIPISIIACFIMVGITILLIFSLGTLNFNYSKAAIVKNRVSKAQYLPNVSMLTNDQDTKSYAVEEDLSFDLKDYNKIVDELAIITGTAVKQDTSILDLKNEVYTVLDLIPVFGKWFNLPHYHRVAPALQEVIREYNNYYYKVDYDETEEKISITRMTWRTSCTAYFASIDDYYCSNNDDDVCQHQIMKLNYYYNEDNKEVVECSVIDFCVFEKELYPIQCQYLENIENTSTTKIQTVLRKELNVYPEFDDGNISDPVDIEGGSDSGYLRKITQLNYTDSNNVELLKIEQNSSTDYYSDIKTTNMAYYLKKNEQVSYFIDAWDYYDDSSYDNIELHNMFDRFYYDYTLKENILNSFINSQYVSRQVMSSPNIKISSRNVCNACYKRFINSGLLVYKCNHNKNKEYITRGSRQIIASSDEYKNQVYQLMPFKVSCQLSLFARTLGVNEGISMNISSMDESYQFETDVDAVIDAISKDYIKNVSLIKDLDSLYNEIIKEAKEIEADELNTSAISSVIKIEDFTHNTQIEDNTILVEANGMIKSSILLEKGANYSIGLVLFDQGNNKNYVLLTDYKEYNGDDLSLSLNGSYDISQFTIKNKDININYSLNLVLGFALVKDSHGIEPICSDYITATINQDIQLEYNNVINGFKCFYVWKNINNTLNLEVVFEDVESPKVSIPTLNGEDLVLEPNTTVFDLMKLVEYEDNDMISSIRIYHENQEYNELFDEVLPGEHKMVVVDRSGNETIITFNVIK